MSAFAYTPMYDEPDIGGELQLLLRAGDVLEVLEQSLETQELYGSEDYWYRISAGGQAGWVFGAALRFYASPEEAGNASRALQQEESY